MKKILVVTALLIISSNVFYGCKTLKEISKAITNIERLQFKLDNVENFAIAGITLSNKKSVSDLSLTDGLKLGNAFATKKFPATFILNVAAKNPNDGSKNTQSTDAFITGFAWRLFIDNVETISGDINKKIKIPGTGQTEIIPLSISLDLYEFFGKKGYEGILNLAMSLGGVDGSTSKIILDAKPTVSTSFGPMTYPGRIKIVDTEFKG